MTQARLRLTAFYAGLLAAACGLVLAVSYLLVRAHLERTLDADAAQGAVSALAGQYALALVAVVLLAAGGGWLVSGEVLAPLERAIAAQRRFVANASHELRTPTTAIRVEAEVALDDPDATVADLREALRATVRATEEQDRLMTALLALASATEGTRADERVDLRAVVRAQLPHAGQVVADLAPSEVRGDASLLGRAAANLIDNAVRHGRPGGRVTVRLREGLLVVANGGAPIEQADLARLTEPFERLTRSGAPGTGLGLSIVDAIARAHGGSLRLRAPEQGGLEATLALPGARTGQE